MTFHHPAQSVTCNGATIPFFGLGTWELRGAAARSMVREAIAMGICHIDTARFYDNERDVGAGIHASGVAREEIFVTTKIPPGLLDAPNVVRTAEAALSDLGIGYIDLLLIHWPSRDVRSGRRWEPSPA